MAYRDMWWPPPSKPRPAKGGIRSRSRRGAFGESWWARRWIEVLEGFPIGARLGRGRSYARKGQVLDIEVEPGEVTARVQGSRRAPYRVTVGLPTLSEEDRRAVAQELARHAQLAAGLLAGEMPPELEEAFLEAGAPLFPEQVGDLETACSCPDWSNPCKHIAAVYYLVAEELDRNPFLLLRLRGFRRRDLVEATGEETGARAGEKAEEKTEEGAGETAGVVPAVGGSAVAEEEKGAAGGHDEEPAEASLPADPQGFWDGVEEEAEPAGEEQSPETPGAGSAQGEEAAAVHLRSLGRIPFWRGDDEPGPVLEEMCRNALPLGLEILVGPEE
jgi:uncharacterized Zn finger protein